MATRKQIEANRANSKHSSGPKTKNGRLNSSRNALRHGLSRRWAAADKTEVETLASVLLMDSASMQAKSASELAQSELKLLRIRRVRGEMLGLLLLKDCTAQGLKRLLALDRYERSARAKRRRAGDGMGRDKV
jgi:hypothetical protein